MTEEQIQQFEQLQTPQERAAFLLNIGVTAKPDIVDLQVVARACVGNVYLPITAATEELAIKRGTAWLQEKAGVSAQEVHH